MTLEIEIPRLEDYGISPATGFLPEAPPLRRLISDEFAPWEEALDDLHGLLLTRRVRERIRQLPLLDVTKLETEREMQRAFLVLCMLGHAYVWGDPACVEETLPACIAVPWTKVADHLGLCPVVCHASVILWNWRLVFADEPLSLDNLTTLHTYSGSLDESWFYLVTTAIEYVGAPALPAILEAIQAVRSENHVRLLESLTEVRSAIVKINSLMPRMYERCDPHVFYHKVRTFLRGWENMKELPRGLRYEGVEPPQLDTSLSLGEARDVVERQYRQYAGGSAAQSPLIHSLDIALGVEHRPTGEQPHHASSNRRNNFIERMRQYMLGKHRRFLEHLRDSANIRDYVQGLTQTHPNDINADLVVRAYNDCIDQLKVFRDKHIQMVSLYVVNQSKKTTIVVNDTSGDEKKQEMSASAPLPTPAPSRSASPTENVSVEQTVSPGSSKVVRGTGGTNVIPFLKQTRDETLETKIDQS
ncbi:uncharacterized protein VTP21DRAFT_2289 [Calcarisporiella thermophila]|uniref:uncharacterized protein n=1 Tax=Calcarisporiella thermophila TaxID=911321 RepID=UPI0037425784